MTNLQKVILKTIINDEDYCRQALPHIKAEYFENEYEPVYKLILAFLQKYNKLPNYSALDVEFQKSDYINKSNRNEIHNLILDLKNHEEVEREWLLNSTEEWCKQRAVYLAIIKSISIIDGKDKQLTDGAIPGILSNALQVSFDKNVGHDYFENSDNRYDFYHLQEDKIPFDLSLFNTITKGAWASGGNLNTGRFDLSSAGTQTAGLAAGGATPGPSNTGTTEEYNGTTWSEQNDLNTARRVVQGAGTQTAALCMMGYVSSNVANTEEYDGTSWTAANNASTARRGGAGFGLQTAAAYAGGYSTTTVATTEHYDGTNWSSGGNLNSAQSSSAAVGTLTAGLQFGGSPDLDTTEEYDGSSWSNGGNMGTGRYNLMGNGSQTDALAAGGAVAPASAQTLAENYNGTSWSNFPSLGTAQYRGTGPGAAPASLGIIFGGVSDNDATQEFTGTTETVASKTLTTS